MTALLLVPQPLLGQMLVGLAHTGQSDPSARPDIDAAIFPAYLEGLAAEDYRAIPAQVRLGYLGSLAARSALSALPLDCCPARRLRTRKPSSCTACD